MCNASRRKQDLFKIRAETKSCKGAYGILINVTVSGHFIKNSPRLTVLRKWERNLKTPSRILRLIGYDS
jgi:hypothetical protein